MREKCLESFAEFVRYFYKEVNNAELRMDWHVEYICDEVQKVSELVIEGKDKKYDLIVQLPPGCSKSSIISVLLPVWIWCRKQKAHIFNTTYSQMLANDFSIKRRCLIGSDKFTNLFPEIKFNTSVQKNFFSNKEGGYQLSLSAGSAVIGHHYDIFIGDELTPPHQQCNTPAILEKVNAWVDQTVATRAKDNRNSASIIVGTNNDVISHRLKTRTNVKLIRLPAELTANVEPRELKQNYSMGLLNASRQYLDSVEAQIGELEYKRQYLFEEEGD
jgi:hypothetical protein